MSLRNGVLLAVAALLIGFFWGRSTVDRREIPLTRLNRIPKAEGLISPIVHEQPSTRQPLDEPWALPAALLLKHWPVPRIDYATGKFEYATLVKYGLDNKDTKNLQNALNEGVESLFAKEIEHSKLITDAEGNQFFEIQTFTLEGQQLKDSLTKIILESFSTFPDQRGSLLAASVDRHPVFDGFGEFKTEMAIELAGKKRGAAICLETKVLQTEPHQGRCQYPAHWKLPGKTISSPAGKT